jgi:hypothetical protein
MDTMDFSVVVCIRCVLDIPVIHSIYSSQFSFLAHRDGDVGEGCCPTCCRDDWRWLYRFHGMVWCQAALGLESWAKSVSPTVSG